MGIRVVVEPRWPLVKLDVLKAHLRVDDDDSNDIIELYGCAASEKIDGPAGDLGHAFGIQDLELTLDCFGSAGIELPYPPLREILALTYFDESGVERSIDVVDLTISFEADFATISLAPNSPWPATEARPDAVKVLFRAGHETMPPGPQAAIMLMTGDLYENRGTVGTNLQEVPMSMGVTRLLARYRHAIIA